MTSKKVYCYECGRHTEYAIKKIKKSINVKGVMVCANVYEAHCVECGEKVFVQELEKQNDIIVYDAYKKSIGLLTSEEIKAIRLKRKWTQTKMARFLNIGEKDITRYENGSVQARNIDDMIRLIDNDESFRIIVEVLNKEEYVVSEKKISSFVDELINILQTGIIGSPNNNIYNNQLNIFNTKKVSKTNGNQRISNAA